MSVVGELSQAESATVSSPSRWRDSIVLALACCVLYLPLHQQAVSYGREVGCRL